MSPKGLGRSEVLDGHRQSLPERYLWGRHKSHSQLWEIGAQEEQRENKSLLDFRGKQPRDITQPCGRTYVPNDRPQLRSGSAHRVSTALKGEGHGLIAALSSSITNNLYVQTMEIVPFPTRFFRAKWRIKGSKREAVEAGQWGPAFAYCQR